MEFLSSLQSGIDEQKPSLFELLSETQLSSLLPPTLRYLLVRATQHHPRYVIRLLNNFPEAYALLQLTVEHYYLTRHAASFTENFYGLKRERIPHISTSGHGNATALPRAQAHPASSLFVRSALSLRSNDIHRNLLVLVGVPYLLRKLDESYEVHAAPSSGILRGQSFQQRDTLPADATLRQRAWFCYKWFLRWVWPHANFSWQMLALAFQLAYLFDGSRFHSPLLWLVGTRVRRISLADMRAAAAATDVGGGENASGTRRLPGWRSLLDPRMAWGRALGSLKILLPTSVFALKFLEWWHASDFARQLAKKASEGLELPPPVLFSNNAAPCTTPTNDKSQAPEQRDKNLKQKSNGRSPPISKATDLPIFTVPPTPKDESRLCPICRGEITTATATPYGYVFCYGCIFRWIEGNHERQREFMDGCAPGSRTIGSGEVDGWRDESADRAEEVNRREGKWENGRGRCAVSGMRILGGTSTLRRIVV